jgi:hypothetical protein
LKLRAGCPTSTGHCTHTIRSGSNVLVTGCGPQDQPIYTQDRRIFIIAEHPSQVKLLRFGLQPSLWRSMRARLIWTWSRPSRKSAPISVELKSQLWEERTLAIFS